MAPETAAPRRWLSIVGIGEDGVDGLSPVARALVSGAEIVFGGKRHLGLAASLIRGAARPWPSPFDRAVEEVLAQRGRQVCVLASGDPFLYGVGSVLARQVAPEETVVVPSPSAFSLAAARLGWALPETALVSLHGRKLDLVRPHLQPGARMLALTSDGDGPAAFARLLADSGFGASRLRCWRRSAARANACARRPPWQFDLGAMLDSMSWIEVVAEAGARIIARAAGLSDDLFEHDGQITKREVRAVTLSSLARTSRLVIWPSCSNSTSLTGRAGDDACPRFRDRLDPDDVKCMVPRSNCTGVVVRTRSRGPPSASSTVKRDAGKAAVGEQPRQRRGSGAIDTRAPASGGG